MAGQEIFVPKSTVRCMEVRASQATGKWYAILEQDFDVCLPGRGDLLGELADYVAAPNPTGRVVTLSCTYSLKAQSAKKPPVKAIQQLLDKNPQLRIVRLLSSEPRKGFRAKLFGKSYGKQAGLLILDQHNRPEYVLSYLSDGRDDLCGEIDQRGVTADDCAPLPDELLGRYQASLDHVAQLREQSGQRPNGRIPAPIAAQLAQAMR